MMQTANNKNPKNSSHVSCLTFVQLNDNTILNDNRQWNLWQWKPLDQQQQPQQSTIKYILFSFCGWALKWYYVKWCNFDPNMKRTKWSIPVVNSVIHDDSNILLPFDIWNQCCCSNPIWFYIHMTLHFSW